MGEKTEGGIGIVGFLCVGMFLLFLGLKLTHQIDWSWWWIFAPLWIPVALVILIIIVVIIIFLIIAWMS